MTEIGTKRCVTRFAWLPVTLDDGGWIWLKRFKSHEKFIRRMGGVEVPVPVVLWKRFKAERI